MNTQRLGDVIRALGRLTHDIKIKRPTHEGARDYCRSDPEELMAVEQFITSWSNSWKFLAMAFGNGSHFFPGARLAAPGTDFSVAQEEPEKPEKTCPSFLENVWNFTLAWGKEPAKDVEPAQTNGWWSHAMYGMSWLIPIMFFVVIGQLVFWVMGTVLGLFILIVGLSLCAGLLQWHSCNL